MYNGLNGKQYVPPIAGDSYERALEFGKLIVTKCRHKESMTGRSRNDKMLECDLILDS